MSLSARRAWIEILPALKLIACHNVALRKESVDRNTLAGYFLFFLYVALRKESVDRNWPSQHQTTPISCRSPQGERG